MMPILSQILFDAARSHADRSAVVLRDEQISYEQLEEQSNQLANTLKSNGVHRGDRVGIYMNKSINSIVSIFAILKADAICVPLDPTGPTQRNAYIISDCDVQCLISHSSKRRGLADILANVSSIRSVVLMSDKNVIEGFDEVSVALLSDVLSAPKVAPMPVSIDIDPAYILYTSGSTGKPKGVIISHLNAMTFVDWATGFFAINSADRVSSHAPLHFDLSIFDIFATMRAGATVCLVPPEINAMPKDLIKFAASQKITIWQSVPSVLVLMINNREIDNHQLDHVRAVLFAGEVFPPKFLRKLMLTVTSAEYYNIYGATEINDVTCYHIEQAPEEDAAPLPIGKACSFAELFVVGDQGNRVTESATVGELYARGSNVARGYWGDSEKSNQRFVQNPLHNTFVDPVYRTGDRVKLDADGNYIYMGRTDSQVKVRGYRVSLDEVEGALLRYPGIDEVSVVALSDENDDHFLKAFIVAKGDVIIDHGGLKKHCLKYVPKYMLPEEIEQGASLPKTSTGKVDKQKLKAARTFDAAV